MKLDKEQLREIDEPDALIALTPMQKLIGALA
jgi:hypothetical protein